MNEHDDEKQFAPVTLRRSSQKGGYGWTVSLAPDVKPDDVRIHAWVAAAWRADALMRKGERESASIQLTEELEASLNGGKP